MSALTKAAVGIFLMAALAAGCNAASRHKALTTFFDGVPPPEETQDPAATGTAPSGQGPPPAARNEHGPYAAKACDACHDATAANALVVPADELCGRCHEVTLSVAYVHGPLASGGCLVCHDPHASPYDALLVSASDSFCFSCHDEDALSPIEEHAGSGTDCTGCHDAHGSDKKYFLR